MPFVEKFKSFVHKLYHEVVGINDTPFKIAAGLGLGVFLGIMPWMGIIAAIIISTILPVNRAAAIVGSLLTNTWLTLISFVLAINIGSKITGMDQAQVESSWRKIFDNFHFKNLFTEHALELIYPTAIGFLIISFCLGVFVALTAYVILMARANRINKKS